MNVFERSVYWVIWVGSCLYSLYCFSKASDHNYQFLYSEDFQEGWRFLNRKQDSSDIEWKNFARAFLSYWPWIVGQIIVTQVFLARNRKYLPIFYVGYSSVLFVQFIGITSVLIYLCCVLVMYIIHKSASRILCLLVPISVLCLSGQPYYLHLRKYFTEDEIQSFMFDIGFGWMIARCISFSIDRINNKSYKSTSAEDLIGILAYCFYLPVFFCGPLLSYDLFIEQLNAGRKKWTLSRIQSVVYQLLRYLSSYVILEFLLHFLYSSALQFYPSLVYKLDSWMLCGLGYSLPVLFYLKYFIIYGLAGLIAEIEQFNFPPPPKCISRIHLSSYQWRHFDRGLHLWLLKYIYYPVVGLGQEMLTKAIGGFLCFSFVYIWHGMGKSICMWSILSFIGVILENVASNIKSTKLFRRIGNYRHFQAFVGTFSFMMMCLSCVFFLSNWEVGMCFVRRVVLDYPIPLVPTFFILYCGSQVSIDVLNWEKRAKGH